MKRSIHGLLCFLSVILLLTNCRKKAFEEFYDRPSNLADPIYQQLQARKNFTSLITLIDKSGYKETLSSAGSWTFFAADDAAFQTFIQEEGPALGISNVDQIDAKLAEKIVRYSMAYDGEKKDRLSDYFSRTGFVENQAFRRRSLYYDFVYDTKNQNNQDIKAIANNRNFPFIYANTDFNNKYLPIFLSPFMQASSLQGSDYQAFYGREYTGFHVGTASVKEEDIIAENGVMHIIDRVLTPPPSIDQYIDSNNNYSSYRTLLNKFVSYSLNPEMTQKYKVLTGSSQNVYVKMYNGSVPFSPNNEGHVRLDANDAQVGSYSIVAPNNEAVAKYSKEVLLKYFPSGTTLEDLAVTRLDIVQAFVTSHMFGSTLWPGKFNSTSSSSGEIMKMSAADIVEKKALSNGFFYGTKLAQDANIFASVYGKVFLDPKFSMMKAALDRYGFSVRLQTPSFKYILIPVSNALLQQQGFTYEPAAFPNAPFRYNGNGDDVRIRRLIGTHVIDLNNVSDIPDLNGEGFLLTALNEPDNFEYIRFKNGSLYSAGTLDSGYVNLSSNIVDPLGRTSVRIDSLSAGSNGTVVYAGGALMFTNTNVGISIQRNGQFPTDPYYEFFQFLRNSPMYNNVTGAINGVELGLNYTILIPTNEEVRQAVADKILPGVATSSLILPTYAPADEAEKAKVERFIRYHILNKVTIVPDGNSLRKGLRETLLKNQLGDPIPVEITVNTTTTLKLKDGFGRESTVIQPTGNALESSLLSNRTVIHQIDKYLQYSF
ncbi:MAG: fasciclin domain-containing protein [Sphingobacteriaceae bacterium]|nr:fasciclin domain-containing protein [Sphingobacteriaceae bacterium]